MILCPSVSESDPHWPERGRLEWEVRAFVDRSDGRVIDCSRDPEAAWRELLEVWERRGDLILFLDQLALPNERHLGELEGCPHDWCACPPSPSSLDWFRGVVKVSWRLQHRHADLVQRIGELGPFARHWAWLPAALGHALRERHVSGPHLHHPLP
jgi:hypothetical protein